VSILQFYYGGALPTGQVNVDRRRQGLKSSTTQSARTNI
jgi:hypothetical protein